MPRGQLSEREARRAGLLEKQPKGKPTTRTPGQHDPQQEEYCPPGAWSSVLRDDAYCAACGSLTYIRLREIIKSLDDGVMRCRPCFDARRKRLRAEAKPPHPDSC